jgi:hypothetical protein
LFLLILLFQLISSQGFLSLPAVSFQLDFRSMKLLPYDRGWQGSGRAQGNPAPNLAKGWLTRFIGRLLKEASPIN